MSARVCVYEGGLVLCQGYVVETPQGLIAVDAPAGMAKWIIKNFPNKKVTDLLITHMHFDHIEDVTALKEAFGCQIHAHSPYSSALSLVDMANSSWGMNLRIPHFDVDDVLGDTTTTATWGGLDWKLYAIPGHSPDSMVYHLAEQGDLFSGDVLFAGSIGRTDFPGGNLDILLSGIKQHLFTLDVHTKVYAGHGSSTTIGEEIVANPYLS